VPNFSVVTERVADQALTLDALAKNLHGATGPFSSSADAAAATPAAEALAEATRCWAQACDQFAGSLHDLGVAVVAAAECYAVTDSTAIPG
jgi:hypothetical protein